MNKETQNIKEQLEEVIKKNLPEKKEILNKIDSEDNKYWKANRNNHIGFNQALSKIPVSLIADEVLKVVVEKIKEEKTRLKNIEWNPQWNLEIEDKIEEVNKILQLLSNLSPNKENENNES